MSDDNSEYSEQAFQDILKVSFGLNIFSLLCDLTIIVGYCILRLYNNGALVDRVSLRLIVMTAVIDLWNQFSQIFWYSESTSHTLCFIFSWFLVFINHFYYALNFTIAFNIYLLVLRNKSYSPKREKFYWIFALCSGLVATVIFLVISDLISKGSRKCYLKSQEAISVRLMYFLTDGLLFVLSIILNLSISIITFSKVNRPFQYKNIFTGLSQEKLTRHLPKIRRLTLLVIMFPLIPIITQTFMLLYQLTAKLTERTSHSLESLAFITSSLNGIIYFLFLIFDPTVQFAFKEIYHSRHKQLAVQPIDKSNDDIELPLEASSSIETQLVAYYEFRELTKGF